jgi:hypothetical protein
LRVRLRALSPGVAVDIEDVAMLCEAVDQGYDASGSGEDGAPFLEGEIGGDDRAGAFVPSTDDAVEEIARNARRTGGIRARRG